VSSHSRRRSWWWAKGRRRYVVVDVVNDPFGLYRTSLRVSISDRSSACTSTAATNTMGIVEKVYTDSQTLQRTALIFGYKIKEIEEEMARSRSLPCHTRRSLTNLLITRSAKEQGTLESGRCVRADCNSKPPGDRVPSWFVEGQISAIPSPTPGTGRKVQRRWHRLRCAKVRRC
jgi:hypothetical protein